MKIAIGSDHGGYEMKEILKCYLSSKGYEIRDAGTFSKESCDYPDFAKKVAGIVSSEKDCRGILICRSGMGMCITANRFRGVRAAVCHDEETARIGREHNDINVLCLGADFTNEKESVKIVEAWLNTGFDDSEKRARRLKKMNE